MHHFRPARAYSRKYRLPEENNKMSGGCLLVHARRIAIPRRWCSRKPIPWNITLNGDVGAAPPPFPYFPLSLPLSNSASVGPMIKRYCVVNLYDARQPAAWCVSVMRFANWGNAARKRFDPLRNPSSFSSLHPFGQFTTTRIFNLSKC